jgi:hypothetical protein
MRGSDKRRKGMSRSGYTDDGDSVVMYRGAVLSSVKGKRGRTLLIELAAAMDAMPEKELIANELVQDGAFCALGVVGAKRGIDMSKLDPEDAYAVADAFDIAPCLAREIVFVNDDEMAAYRMKESETPAERWQRVRKWVQNAIDKPGSVF